MNDHSRALGNSELETAPLMLGSNVFGWNVDEPTSFRLLDLFVDAGFNAIDTADVYSNWKPGNKGGESEAIIGNWIRRRGERDRVLVATKVGHPMGKEGKGLSRAHILRAAEASLARLQTDYIDLYQAHVYDAQTPVEETLEALARLVEQGKVRVIGASNHSADELRGALDTSLRLGLPSYQCLQPHYNLCVRSEYEGALEALCRERQLGVIPYFALAAGFLTGKYRSEGDLGQSPRGNRAKQYLNERGFRILDALDLVAKEEHANPAQVAIAWLCARPSVTAPIASATSQEQLDDLIAGARLKLDQTQIDLLNSASC